MLQKNTATPDLFQFDWQRTTSGYRWIETTLLNHKGKQSPQWFLTDGLSDPETQQEPYSVLDGAHSGLFDEFASIDYQSDRRGALIVSIDPDPQSSTSISIREFADKYGLLTTGELIRFPESAHNYAYGEARDVWEREIERARRVLNVWNMVKEERNHKELKKVICWETQDAVFYDETGKWDRNEKGDYDPGALARWEPISHYGVTTLKKGEVERAAWCYVRQHVNVQLAQHVTARFEVETHHPFRCGVVFMPSSLLGAMWLQFAQLIEGQGEYRKCLYCRRPFAVGVWPKTPNPKRRYCKDSCRVLAFQREQRQKMR
jgi:hypothetical protein